MQYLGGKYRIRKKLGAFLTEQAKGKDFFLDMFCGAGNVVTNVDHPNRYANDGSKYVIAVLKRAQRGGEFPDVITEEFFQQVKNNKDAYPDWLVGFVGFGCAFGGSFFSGYAREHHTRPGLTSAGKASRSFQKVDYSRINFSSYLFNDFVMPEGPGLIYCDPPYEGTTGYSIDFDTEQFYRWSREQARRHTVLVSEYEHNARGPVVWKTQAQQTMAGGVKNKVNKVTTEVVFQVLP